MTTKHTYKSYTYALNILLSQHTDNLGFLICKYFSHSVMGVKQPHLTVKEFRVLYHIVNGSTVLIKFSEGC